MLPPDTPNDCAWPTTFASASPRFRAMRPAVSNPSPILVIVADRAPDSCLAIRNAAPAFAPCTAQPAIWFSSGIPAFTSVSTA
jgi:hypothetical protein